MSGRPGRRSSAQVRHEILEAAGVVFGEKGYTGATSRDLARAAGVSESVLYRHFGSKSNLFAEAVVTPFAAVLEAFSDLLKKTVAQPLDLETLMRLFLTELVEQLTHHRRELRMFLAAEDQLDEDTKALFYERFHGVIASLTEIVAPESRRRGRKIGPLGSDMNVRATLGLVFAVAILDDWFMPPGPAAPSREQLIEHLGVILIHGM